MFSIVFCVIGGLWYLYEFLIDDVVVYFIGNLEWYVGFLFCEIVDVVCKVYVEDDVRVEISKGCEVVY